MSQAISEQAIVEATGQSWEHWLRFLQQQQAEQLAHKAIADLLRAQGGVSGWWAQMLTVRFEQHIGRRVTGQDCTGQFKLSVNKTLAGPMDDALALWLGHVQSRTEFNQVAISKPPAVSQSANWRYWRCALADGSRVVVMFSQKTADKTQLSVQHEQLKAEAELEPWRSYWKEFTRGL
ncbi:hypothetical protein [Rheinheimera sp.]|uniref:hypothetical protein n=1 Tax=Rheinheimera sp. TaxID=1869214 RepID=UPI00307EFD08